VSSKNFRAFRASSFRDIADTIGDLIGYASDIAFLIWTRTQSIKRSEPKYFPLDMIFRTFPSVKCLLVPVPLTTPMPVNVVLLTIAVLTHKVLCGTAPRYLGPLNRVADVSGRRSLRSSGTNRLVVPPFRLSTVGSRAFPVAAAKIWNALPDSLVAIMSLQSFRRHSKTFLFQRSFC